MKKTLILFLSVLAAGWLVSCDIQPSEAVDQDRIRADYELFYDKNTNQTAAKATFRFGNITGTLLKLNAPAQVRFNEDVLTLNAIGTYEKIYNGFVSTGTFNYTDAKGKTYSNAVPALKSIDYPADPVTLLVSRSQDYTLTWAGDPLSTGEGVGLIVGTTPFGTNTTGAKSVVLGTAGLQLLQPGAYLSVMDRSLISALTQQTSIGGGSMTSKYRAKNKNVQVSN